MKPFNLEQALAGAPVVTRKGCPIVELKYLQTTGNLAVVREDDEKLISYFVPCSGKLSNTIDYATDLFMTPQKKEGWINLYQASFGRVPSDKIHPSKEAAINTAKKYDWEPHEFVTIKIEWEE